MISKKALAVIKRAQLKTGKKYTAARTVNYSIKNAIKATDLGNGFGRFVISTTTLPPNTFRRIEVFGNSFNIISGSWVFSGDEQGYMLDSYSSAEDHWFFTAWNPTNSTRLVTVTVIAKRKP
ncbi:hypothetical protein [Paenibacillus sp. LjRoot56]|uniref:hypothetical protein n=1 Tax=Paenibacillus sp. LjRoot56 TaxID=3342333 RepID=UPI003ED04B99